MLWLVLASWLDFEYMMIRFPQLSRGGMAYYEHAQGTTTGPGPNTGLRVTYAKRASPRWMFGAAATGVWGHLGYLRELDTHAQAYTWQLGFVARWVFAENIPRQGMYVTAALRAEVGIAGIHARADGMEIDSARRQYGSFGVELRYGGPRVKFLGSLATTQPLGDTERVVGDEFAPQLPLGGFEMILGVSITR